MNWKSGAAVAALGALIGGGAMMLAAPATAPNRGLDTAIRTYILNHPEIIQEAADKLQTRALAKVVDANRSAFESPFAGAWAGNRRGDVTLVEFFDYSCGYCRTSVPHIDRLLKEDPGLRVVYRELPVLGPDSEAAAFASLAAAAGPNYKRFHNAMFAAGRPNPATIARVAAANGVAGARPSPEARAEIENNVALARAAGVTGTPAFIVGDQVIGSAVGYEALKRAVAEARAGRS